MTRKNLLSAGGILTVLVACVAYLVTGVLSTPLLRSTPTVTVEMERTGGLFEGSEATYRGVKVGRVTDLRLTDTGVVATVEITADRDIPASSRVVVRSLSPVGEQYLDFQPTSTAGPYLGDGDRIRAEAVDLPQSLGNMAISLDRLIQQVDADSVRTVLEEVSAGLAGTEQDLRRLVTQGSDLLSVLEDTLPATERLLRNGRTVLQVGADEAEVIRRIARNAELFAAWLRRFAPTFFAILEDAPGQIEELRGLVLEAADLLPPLLDRTVTITDLLAARDPHLRELLARFPDGIDALARAVQDGAAQLDLVLQRGAHCRYATPERQPRDTSTRALQTDGRCDASFTGSQRGAQHAPGPVR